MTDRLDALLDDAVAAVRVSAEDGVTDGAATRLRLRESLARRRSPRKIITIIAAVIATMFGSTAFAYYVGGWRPSWIERATPAPAPVVVIAEPAAAAEPRMPARTVRRDVEPPHVEPSRFEPKPRVERPPSSRVKPPSRVEPPASPSPVESPSASRVESTSRVEPPSTSSSPAEPSSSRVEPPSTSRVAPQPRVDPPSHVVTPKTDPELAAYRLAHEAHFRGTDPNKALAAWDAYLAKFPNGRLVLEARYDRALVLIKLRRFGEARAALKPFAEGTYRKAEAIKLLSAIEHR